MRGQTNREEAARNRALHVLARLRRTDTSLTAATREERTTPGTVRKYVGTELKRLTKGRIQPTKTDQARRRMLIPTPRGATPVVIRGSEQASELGRYMSAVGRYLRTGSTDGLEEFEGLSIANTPLITDPDTLTELAQAGALQLDEIYAVPESTS